MVWGYTFQTTTSTRNMIGEAAASSTPSSRAAERAVARPPAGGADAGCEGARVRLPKPDGGPQGTGARFPQSDLRADALSRRNATLRGFYFTSGTQQGTPIDQLIGIAREELRRRRGPNLAYSGKGKSFFLTDLLRKVVIGEAGWVSHNRTAVRRSLAVKAAAFAALGAVSLAVAPVVDQFRTQPRAHRPSTTTVVDYRAIAAPVLRETTVSDRNFNKVLPLLQKLRHLPAGYASRGETEPMLATFGLSQRDRLHSASDTAYGIALERLFRSRLIYRLEEQLEGNINNPAFVYEALKVYLMLGGPSAGRSRIRGCLDAQRLGREPVSGRSQHARSPSP